MLKELPFVYCKCKSSSAASVKTVAEQTEDWVVFFPPFYLSVLYCAGLLCYLNNNSSNVGGYETYS